MQLKAAGQTSGANNSFYGGNKYEWAIWVGCDDKQCYTTTLIGGNSWSKQQIICTGHKQKDVMLQEDGIYMRIIALNKHIK